MKIYKNEKGEYSLTLNKKEKERIQKEKKEIIYNKGRSIIKRS
ncbi:MAG TPA: hypothetical protein PK993_03885 [Clostridia bacterium]|nr:hypothetical protein [Clostridia bacterium]